MRLSTLRYSPVDRGLSATDAFTSTLRLACLAEEKGFHRYWVTAERPQLFVLRASSGTAEFAVQLGLGFTFAHFTNPTERDAGAAQAYRERSSLTHSRPNKGCGFRAIVDTEAEARDFANGFHLWLVHAGSTNAFERVPSPETTRAH